MLRVHFDGVWMNHTELERYAMKNNILLTILTAFACVAVAGSAWQAQRLAAEAMEKSAYERLTSLREAKRREILTYLERTQAHVDMLARIPTMAEAAVGFAESFTSIPGSPDDAAIVRNFYEREVAHRLNGGLAALSVSDLIPTAESALAAQSVYIAANRFDVGSKDELVNTDAGGAYAKLHAAQHTLLRSVVRTHGFYDLFLIHPGDGRVVYSVFKEVDFGTSLRTGPHRESGLARAFHAAMSVSDSDPAVIADFSRYAPSYFAPAAFVAAPIRTAEGIVGVLAVQLPIDRLNYIMTGGGRWAEDGLGESGETYLVGSDKLMRSDSRFLIESPDRFLAALGSYGLDADMIRSIQAHKTTILFQSVDTVATRLALAGESGTQIVDDYRGIAVLSSYAPLEVCGLHWSILSEIDEEEAFAPVRALGRGIALITVLVIFAFVGIAFFLSTMMARQARMERERARIDHDLNIARSIQQGLLPQTVPKFAQYDIAGWSQPADATGGDYYDWQELPNRRLAVTLADVTGHGIGPALVTAVCRAYSRASLVDSGAIGPVLTRINTLLHEDLPADRFVTFVVAILDAENHKIEVMSAGHGPIFFYRAADRTVAALDAHEIPLGVTGALIFEASDCFLLEPGDMIVLVTDGFFEWANPEGELYGTDRLSTAIRDLAEENASTIIERLYRSVAGFANGVEQDDDLTAVVIKRQRINEMPTSRERMNGA